MLGDINLTLKPQNQTKQILQHRYKNSMKIQRMEAKANQTNKHP